MNLSFIQAVSKKVLETLGPLGLSIRQKSPEILLGAGIVGVGAGVVLTARQTMKLQEELDVHNAMVEDVKHEHTQLGENGIVKDDQYAKEMARVYLKTGARITKLYAPPAVATIAGIAGIIGSHNIQSGRIAGLSAAYTGLSAAYDSYRERVRGELGDERERELALGIEKLEVEEVITGKNGKEKKVKTFKNYLQPNQVSLYTFIFDESNPAWSRSDGYNKSFLIQKQEYWNQRFNMQGYVFLSDVLYDLGFDITNLMYTRMVGWCKGLGDDFIDFGLFEAYNREKCEFVNCYEPSIWLDFNVDGEIIHKIGVGLPEGILDPDLEYKMTMAEVYDEEKEHENE